jgi:hypothetical protein
MNFPEKKKENKTKKKERKCITMKVSYPDFTYLLPLLRVTIYIYIQLTMMRLTRSNISSTYRLSPNPINLVKYGLHRVGFGLVGGGLSIISDLKNKSEIFKIKSSTAVTRRL